MKEFLEKANNYLKYVCIVLLIIGGILLFLTPIAGNILVIFAMMFFVCNNWGNPIQEFAEEYPFVTIVLFITILAIQVGLQSLIH